MAKEKISSKPVHSADETAKLVAWAKANGEALRGCQLHDFNFIEPDAVFRQYRCANCGGVVSGEYGSGYLLGLKHSRNVT